MAKSKGYAKKKTMESPSPDPLLESLCVKGFAALEKGNTVGLAQVLVEISRHCQKAGLDVPEKAVQLANVLANQEAEALKITGFVPVLRPPD